MIFEKVCRDRPADTPEREGEGRPQPVDVSLITPTLNEAASIEILVGKIRDVMQDRRYEIVVVDDNSPDRTWEVAERMGQSLPVQVIRRTGKRGLASAVLEGVRASRGEIIGVMDADLSHPPEAIPSLLEAFDDPDVTMVVGSRFVTGGGVDSWPLKRKVTSYLATVLARSVTAVKDPMSGFFFFRRKIVSGVGLRPLGYKIGLELIVRGNNRKIVEVPFLFRDRYVGKSKLGLKQNLEYLLQLACLVAFRLGKRLRAMTAGRRAP